jgi:hypothetical protein
MKKRKLFYFIVICSFLVLFMIPKNIVLGETPTGETPTGETPTGETPTGSSGTTSLPNPLTGEENDPTDSAELFGLILRGFLGIVGTFSLIAFIAGGVMWLTSSGNPEQVKKGKDIFVYALIGIAVVFSSYIVLNFVISTLTGS